MSTSKTAGIAVLHVISTRSAAGKDTGNAVLATGWDPLEVWRTRVLEPSLGLQAATAGKTETAKPTPTLVRAV